MSETRRSTIDVTISPNEVVHTYIVAEEDGPLTETPHIEMLGVDISRLVDEGALPMDEQTRHLYGSIRALSRLIKSVSIQPYEVRVEGPYAQTSDYYSAIWPEGVYIDAKVVRCIADHLKMTQFPRMHVQRETLASRREATRKAVIEQIEAMGGTQLLGAWPRGE